MVDELTDSEVTATRSMRSPASSASQFAARENVDQDQEEPEAGQQQSAAKTASVRFLDENLESVHHFEVPSRESSHEAVIWKWETGSR